MDKAFHWIEEHPVAGGAIIIGGGLVLLYFLGFFSGGSSSGSSSQGTSLDQAYYEALASQAQSNDQVAVAQINANAESAVAADAYGAQLGEAESYNTTQANIATTQANASTQTAAIQAYETVIPGILPTLVNNGITSGSFNSGVPGAGVSFTLTPSQSILSQLSTQEGQIGALSGSVGNLSQGITNLTNQTITQYNALENQANYFQTADWGAINANANEITGVVGPDLANLQGAINGLYAAS